MKKKIKKATPEEIIEFVKKKWNDKKCPMCGNDKWDVSKSYFALQGFDDDDVLVFGGQGSPLMPMVTLICSNCGNIIFINPLSMGLLKQE